MNTPRISIIVPVYNVEPYLRQCLDSLINQTLHDIEIICVDDGSTDSSPSILQEYAAQDERIRIVTQTNRGVSVARNEGIATARAPYILFCDPDDWYELNMCEKMYHALDAVDEADVAMCGAQIEWDYQVSQKRQLKEQAWYSVHYSGLRELTCEMLLHRIPASVWNKIFRRAFLLEHHIQFPENLRYEDIYFHHAFLAYTTHMVFVEDNLYHYRQRKDSCVYNAFHCKPFVGIDRMHIAMLVWDYYKKHDLLGKWDGYIAKAWINYLSVTLRNERTKKAHKLIAKITHSFLKDNDKYTHALSDEQRRVIIRLINKASANPAIHAIKYKVAKRLINLLPAAAWRRRLRRKYL